MISRRTFLLSTAAVVGVAGGAQLMRSGVLAAETIVSTPGKVRIQRFTDLGKSIGVEEVAKVVKTEAEWRAQLASAPQPEVTFNVTRQEGTEWAGTGPNSHNYSPGLYRCICCDNALYTNETKFDSGTGWPSFWRPIAAENVVQNVPDSGGFKVSCTLCDAHLGHVFADGPPPTGLRYCMDGVAMRFIPWPAA